MNPEHQEIFRICKEIVIWSLEAARKGVAYVFSGLDAQRIEAKMAARNAKECIEELLTILDG